MLAPGYVATTARDEALNGLKRTPKAVYDAILAYKRDHDGNSPSVRDLQDATGIKSTSQVVLELSRLELAGLIQIGRGARAIRVRGGRWTLNA